MTYRDELRWIAAENHGVVTLCRAAEEDIPSNALQVLAHRKVLTRTSSGCYLHNEVAPNKYTEFAIALGTVGPTAFLVDDSVLQLHDLAQVSPTFIHVQQDGRRTSKKLPPNVKLERRTREEITISEHEGLRSMSVFDALRRSVNRLKPDDVLYGISRALQFELINENEAQTLFQLLD